MKMNENIPVFLQANENYASALAALIVSIVENSESVVDFYVMDSGLSVLSKKHLKTLQQHYNFGLEIIDVAKYHNLFDLPAKVQLPRATSDKYLVPYIKPELDKAIVLDVDMIAVGDIKKLWEVDLHGKLLGAVPYYGHVDIGKIYDLVREAGMSPVHHYFNSGVLVLDCQQWRKREITQQLFHFNINFNTKKFSRWDEIVLNLLLETNNYHVLEPIFNMMVPHILFYTNGKPYAHKRVIEEHFALHKDCCLNEAVFVHFIFKDAKPWNRRNYFYAPVKQWREIPCFRNFWYYLHLTPFFEGEKLTYIDKNVCGLTSSIPKLMIAQFYTRKKHERRYRRYLFFSAITFHLLPFVETRLKQEKVFLAKS